MLQFSGVSQMTDMLINQCPKGFTKRMVILSDGELVQLVSYCNFVIYWKKYSLYNHPGAMSTVAQSLRLAQKCVQIQLRHLQFKWRIMLQEDSTWFDKDYSFIWKLLSKVVIFRMIWHQISFHMKKTLKILSRKSLASWRDFRRITTCVIDNMVKMYAYP